MKSYRVMWIDRRGLYWFERAEGYNNRFSKAHNKSRARKIRRANPSHRHVWVMFCFTNVYWVPKCPCYQPVINGCSCPSPMSPWQEEVVGSCSEGLHTLTAAISFFVIGWALTCADHELQGYCAVRCKDSTPKTTCLCISCMLLAACNCSRRAGQTRVVCIQFHHQVLQGLHLYQ